jgi:hypothetical protein
MSDAGVSTTFIGLGPASAAADTTRLCDNCFGPETLCAGVVLIVALERHRCLSRESYQRVLHNLRLRCYVSVTRGTTP